MASARKHRDRWVVDYKDETGAKRTKGGFKTERGPHGARAWAEECSVAQRRGPEALAAFLDERLHGRVRSDHIPPTVDVENLVLDDLAVRFFSDLKPGQPDGLAANTHATYLSVYEKHIKPFDGGTPLKRFEGPEAPIEWRDTVLAAGIGDQAFIKAKTCLSSMLSHGVHKRLLTDNGVRRMPQRNRRRSSRAKVVLVDRANDALDPTEVARLVTYLDVAGRQRDALAVEAGFILGLRPQELWALRFVHVDGRRVIVEQVVSLGELEQPKTRGIYPPIPDYLRAQIESWRTSRGAQLADYVFPGTAPPGHLTDSQIRNWRVRVFKAACKTALGREIDGPYALRRGHISVRVGRGESVALIASELGTSPKIIHGHYEKVIAHADHSRPALLEQYLAARAA